MHHTTTNFNIDKMRVRYGITHADVIQYFGEHSRGKEKSSTVEGQLWGLV